MVFLGDISYYRNYYYGVSNNCGTCSKFNESKQYLESNISKKFISTWENISTEHKKLIKDKRHFHSSSGHKGREVGVGEILKYLWRKSTFKSSIKEYLPSEKKRKIFTIQIIDTLKLTIEWKQSIGYRDENDKRN